MFSYRTTCLPRSFFLLFCSLIPLPFLPRPICLSACLFLCRCLFYICLLVSICLPACTSMYLYVYVSACLTISLSVYLSTCLPVYVFLSYSPISLSLPLPIRNLGRIELQRHSNPERLMFTYLESLNMETKYIFRINGVPACINKKTMTDILRTAWKFKGYVVSDQGAMEYIINYHKYMDNYVDVAAAGVNAGCNLELSNDLPYNVYMSIGEGMMLYLL